MKAVALFYLLTIKLKKITGNFWKLTTTKNRKRKNEEMFLREAKESLCLKTICLGKKSWAVPFRDLWSETAAQMLTTPFRNIINFRGVKLGDQN